MTIELVTGHAGSAHVSSADVGMFNAGTIGSGKYVLDTGNRLAASVVSSNSVTIATGDALFEGRHVRVSSAETVAIDNGAQGVNRNDIICIKYQISNGVESASLDVIRGTAAASAVDPAIPSGSIIGGSSTAYFPLWRIPITGITVGTPVALFDEPMTPLADFGSLTADKIPSLPASKIGSGVLPIVRGGTGSSAVESVELASNFNLYKWGKVVFAVAVGAVTQTTLNNNSEYAATIPSGYRPADYCYAHFAAPYAGGARLQFNADGKILYFGDVALNANTDFWLSAVWLTA